MKLYKIYWKSFPVPSFTPCKCSFLQSVLIFTRFFKCSVAAAAAANRPDWFLCQHFWGGFFLTAHTHTHTDTFLAGVPPFVKFSFRGNLIDFAKCLIIVVDRQFWGCHHNLCGISIYTRERLLRRCIWFMKFSDSCWISWKKAIYFLSAWAVSVLTTSPYRWRMKFILTAAILSVPSFGHVLCARRAGCSVVHPFYTDASFRIIATLIHVPTIVVNIFIS